MTRFPWLVGALALALTPMAFAQSDDEDPFEFDDLFEDDDEDDDTEAADDRIDDADDLDFEFDDDDSFEFLDDEEAEDSEDLLDGEEEPEFDDNAVLYRQMLERVDGAEPEEEVELWEAYLRRYPNSAFRDRIDDRMDVVLSELYGDDLGDGPGERDADAQEIDFSQGMLIDNINPRTNIQAGIEWGLPAWGNLYGSYEHALRRDFSVFGGVGRRFTGWGAEAGARYALVKSLRTNMLVTASGALHLNANRTCVGFRPMIGVGKRFGDVLDGQAQIGGELELTGPVGFRLMGGANVTWRAAETVALFGETSWEMKNLTWKEGHTFNFTVLSFGMKFQPTPGGLEPGQLQINVGANVPYASWYWMHHFGSIMAQINFYPNGLGR